MVFDSMVVVVFGFSRVSSVCWAVTSTVCEAAETARLKFSVAVRPTSTAIGLRGLLGKACRAHRYGIGSGIDLGEKKPPIGVGLPGARGLVSTSVAVTAALASAAPEASSTVPEIALDVPLCPRERR